MYWTEIFVEWSWVTTLGMSMFGQIYCYIDESLHVSRAHISISPWGSLVWQCDSVWPTPDSYNCYSRSLQREHKQTVKPLHTIELCTHDICIWRHTCTHMLIGVWRMGLIPLALGLWWVAVLAFHTETFLWGVCVGVWVGDIVTSLQQ